MLRLACEEALFCSCSSMYFKAVFILRMYWAANLTVSTITVEARRSVAAERTLLGRAWRNQSSAFRIVSLVSGASACLSVLRAMYVAKVVP